VSAALPPVTLIASRGATKGRVNNQYLAEGRDISDRQTKSAVLLLTEMHRQNVAECRSEERPGAAVKGEAGRTGTSRPLSIAMHDR